MRIGTGLTKRSQCQCFGVVFSATAAAAVADGAVVDDDGDGATSQHISFFHIKTCNLTLYCAVQVLLLMLFSSFIYWAI